MAFDLCTISTIDSNQEHLSCEVNNRINMDALNQYTFVAPTEDELMVEQPDTLYLSVDDDELANDIIVLS